MDYLKLKQMNNTPTTVKIKPLTVNQCWKGRRTKTDDYVCYEETLYYKLLPSNVFIPKGKLKIYLVFGVSNVNSDWDNPIKPFVDILQKKYNFNDNRIYFASVHKKKVKKGEEYILFNISEYDL